MALTHLPASAGVNIGICVVSSGAGKPMAKVVGRQGGGDGNHWTSSNERI